MFDDLQQHLGYHFHDAALLKRAFSHRSLGRDADDAPSNQRLEFLGDAVLGLAIAHMLYGMFPGEAEGDLSRRLVGLVNGEQLSVIAQGMKLGDYLNMSDSEAEQGGRANASNLEDACEALLGALYLDGGFAAVQEVVTRFWEPLAKAAKAPPKDAKTSLQEWAQARGLPLPDYRVISADGPSHAPQFVIEVHVEGQAPTTGEAGSKKIAERQAATGMLERLGVAL